MRFGANLEVIAVDGWMDGSGEVLFGEVGRAEQNRVARGTGCMEEGGEEETGGKLGMVGGL